MKAKQQVVYDYQDFEIEQQPAYQTVQTPQYVSYNQAQRVQQRPVLLQPKVSVSETAKLEQELASQIADLLIIESSDQAKKSNGKKTTPFVKKALPGESQTYSTNGIYLSICKVSAIFYVLLHLYLYADVFSLWGNGNIWMILISTLQLGCAYYTFALADTNDRVELTRLYGYRYIYLALVGVASFPVGLITMLAFFSYQQADQIAAYEISSNILFYSGATLLPYVTLAAMTVCLWDMRAYEVNDQDIDFGENYHFGPKQATYASKQISKELTIRLLQSYLEEPQAPTLDLEQNRVSDVQIEYL